METLKIDRKNAFKLYPSADITFKQMLEDTFGKEFFNQKITDRVKSYEDACEVLGLDPADNLPYDDPKNADQEASNAIAKMWIIARALNGEWKADWNNSSQYKYTPWFTAAGSGFGLSYGDCDHWCSHAYVGSRLCYKSRELAEYAGKQFIDIYNKFLI